MSKAKVLVVEDDALVALNIESKLRELGYCVPAVVDTGREAIEKSATLQPDLVLMDIRLRGELDGIEAAAEIGERFGIPVVYLTAFSDDATLQRAKAAEPFGYITKPFRIGDLHSLIEIAIYRHELEQKLRQSEARYKSVVEDQAEFILRWLPGGACTFANQSYYAGFRRHPDETLERSIWSAIRHPDPPAFRARLQSVTVSAPVWFEEWETPLGDGQMAWIHWTHRALYDPRERLLEFQSVGRDITEQARVVRELREARDAAEQAMQQERRRRMVAEDLLAVLYTLISDQPLPNVFHLLALKVCTHLQSTAAAILRWDKASHRYEVQAAQGLPSSLTSDQDSISELGALRERLSAEQCLVAAEPREGLRTEDHEAQLPLGRWSSEFPTILAVPVRLEDEEYGALLTCYGTAHPISSQEVELARQLGAQVALAVTYGQSKVRAAESGSGE